LEHQPLAGRSNFIDVRYCTGKRAGKWLAQIKAAGGRNKSWLLPFGLSRQL